MAALTPNPGKGGRLTPKWRGQPQGGKRGSGKLEKRALSQCRMTARRKPRTTEAGRSHLLFSSSSHPFSSSHQSPVTGRRSPAGARGAETVPITDQRLCHCGRGSLQLQRGAGPDIHVTSSSALPPPGGRAAFRGPVFFANRLTIYFLAIKPEKKTKNFPKTVS